MDNERLNDLKIVMKANGFSEEEYNSIKNSLCYYYIMSQRIKSEIDILNEYIKHEINVYENKLLLSSFSFLLSILKDNDLKKGE